VPAPSRCPHCQGRVTPQTSLPPVEHMQEDIIEEMHGITFTPAALIGFETMLADKGESVVDDIAKKLASSDGPVHADETYWTTNGFR